MRLFTVVVLASGIFAIAGLQGALTGANAQPAPMAHAQAPSSQLAQNKDDGLPLPAPSKNKTTPVGPGGGPTTPLGGSDTGPQPSSPTPSAAPTPAPAPASPASPSPAPSTATPSPSPSPLGGGGGGFGSKFGGTPAPAAPPPAAPATPSPAAAPPPATPATPATPSGTAASPAPATPAPATGSGLGPTTPLGGSDANPSNKPIGPLKDGDGLPPPPIKAGGSNAATPAPSPAPGTAAAPPPSSPAPVGPGGLGPTAPLGGPQPSRPDTARGANQPLGEPAKPGSNSAAGNTSCPAQPATITVEQLLGTWTDSTSGETVEIKSADGGKLTLNGRNNWNGAIAGSKVTFSRVPSFDQMANAPFWAREQAKGKLKWELELEVKSECGQPVLEGKWYPGNYKWSETIDPNGSGGPVRTVSDFGRGTPIDKKYTRPPPTIADTIVLIDQTALIANGQPKFPYTDASKDGRLLFVYGRGLPKTWDGPFEFKSEDPHVTYYALALQSEKNLSELRRQQFADGWAEARKNLDAETIETIKDLDALLVEARSDGTVLPGLKQYKLNGMDGSWRLRFGDDRASISFMRAITEDVADPTNAVLLPERVFIEIRTEANFPIDTIPLKIQVAGKLVTWNGEKTLPARRMSPGIYRTDFIEFVEARNPLPAMEKGVFFVPANVKDEVDVRLEDANLLGLTPGALVTHLLRTPAELGETWKEALNRAALADKVKEFTDWNKLSASRATEISNYMVAPILLKTLDYATPLKFLRVAPKLFQYVATIENGKLEESTPVTVGEHAALLLFRDQFVKGMEQALKNLEQIKGNAALRGFREAVKYSAWDTNSPWRYLKVSCPRSGGDCTFPMAVSDYYLEQSFGQDKRAAAAWVNQAVDQALANYKQAAREAIDKARQVKDDDIKGLLRLVGLSYGPMLPVLQMRMMRLAEVGEPRRQLWVPDLNGRYQLRNLNTLVDAVQAQEDYSALDTQMSMLLAAILTAPFLLEEGMVGAVVMWGTDGLQLGVALANDVPEFIRSREEARFALGASLLLGTQRLQEAELKKSEWYNLLASVGPATLGSVLSTVRMVGVVRTSLILRAVEGGGLKAYQALSNADKAAFWRYVTEAKLLDELGETKSITNMHRRAAKAGDEMLSGLRGKAVEAADVKPQATLAATGQPGPAATAKTTTLTLPDDAAEDKVVLTDSGIEYQSESPQAKTKTLVNEPGPDQPKTKTLTNDTAEPSKPANDNEPVKSGANEPAVPKPERTETYGSKNPPTSSPKPQAGQDWPTVIDNKEVVLKLGDRIGGGQYAQVFELTDARIAGCEKKCAIKIILPNPDDAFFSANVKVTGVPVNLVENVQYSSKLVDAASDIPQLRNLEFHPEAPTPFFIQELKREDQALFSGMAQFRAAAAKIPELRSAVVDLAWKLKEHGLIWEDFKVNNMVFWRDVEGKYGAKGKWIAGVLDHDRIIPFAQRDLPGNMGAWFGFIEADYFPEHLTSMRNVGKSVRPDRASEVVKFFRERPGPYYRDIDMFWEKTFEAKKWILYDETTGRFMPNGLQPSDVQIRFRKLNNPIRLDPFDPGIEFNLPRQGQTGSVVPLAPPSKFAARLVGEWRMAA